MEAKNYKSQQPLKAHNEIVKLEPEENVEILNDSVNERKNLNICETSTSEDHVFQILAGVSKITVKDEPIEIGTVEDNEDNEIDSFEMLHSDLEPVEIIFKKEPKQPENIKEMTRPSVEMVHLPADINEIEVKDEPMELQYKGEDDSLPIKDDECNKKKRYNATFNCPCCHKPFKIKKRLTQHLKRHSNNKQLSCRQCSIKFSTKSQLILHKGLHTGKKLFRCNMCKQRFKSVWNLNLHTLRIHSNKRPFSCSYCSRRFDTKTGLIRHVRFHTVERLFVCSMCEQRFSTEENLNNHEISRMHSNKKLFSCINCSKTFATKLELILHASTRTGKKPFYCTVCKSRFIRQACLKYHLKAHMEKPYSCSGCFRKFFHKKSLVAHIAKAHNSQLESRATSPETDKEN